MRTTNAQEMSGDSGKIGPLWNQFMQGGPESIPGVTDPDAIYAVYHDYESDASGAYDLTLGKSVHPEAPAPEGMSRIHIPTARYLVFTADGNSPEEIMAAWRSVYDYFDGQMEQRRAFTFDFEQYSPAGIELYIAIT